MKVTDILKAKKRSLSFEVFPPKTGEAFASVSAAVDEIAALSPDFISVTYGAGGGTSEYSAAIAEHVLRDLRVTPVAHLSCISSDRADVEAKLTRLKDAGVDMTSPAPVQEAGQPEAPAPGAEAPADPVPAAGTGAAERGSAAAQAAPIPAGPPPQTTTSQTSLSSISF